MSKNVAGSVREEHWTRCPGVLVRYSLTPARSTQWKSYVTSEYCLIVNCRWSSALRGSQATVSITCAGYDELDVLLAKKSHHSWSQCLFCSDLTTVIHCWPSYHLLHSNPYKEFSTQLFVWYLTLVFVIMRHLDYNSSTGYRSSTELHLSLCMLMHLIHIGRAPRYMADFVQPIVESSRRPGLRSADTADYVKHRLQSKFAERCFSYAGPAAWNSLPHSIKLMMDTSRFKQLLKSHLFRIAFWYFVSAPWQFVSRSLCLSRSLSLSLSQTKWKRLRITACIHNNGILCDVSLRLYLFTRLGFSQKVRKRTLFDCCLYAAGLSSCVVSMCWCRCGRVCWWTGTMWHSYGSWLVW